MVFRELTIDLHLMKGTVRSALFYLQYDYAGVGWVSSPESFMLQEATRPETRQITVNIIGALLPVIPARPGIQTSISIGYFSDKRTNILEQCLPITVAEIPLSLWERGRGEGVSTRCSADTPAPALFQLSPAPR